MELGKYNPGDSTQSDQLPPRYETDIGKGKEHENSGKD